MCTCSSSEYWAHNSEENNCRLQVALPAARPVELQNSCALASATEPSSSLCDDAIAICRLPCSDRAVLALLIRL